MKGQGKYGKLTDAMILGLGAKGVVLLVFDGKLGSGFSVSTTEPVVLLRVPGMLRRLADELERTREHISDSEAL